MRILHAVHAFPPEPSGGTERHVLGLASGPQRCGHEPIVVAGSQQRRPRLAEVEDQHAGLRVHRDDYADER